MGFDDIARLSDAPESLLHRLINEMTDNLVEAKNHLAECKREERRLSQEVQVLERATDDWRQRAMSAVRAGDDVVAKDALLRKRQNEDQAEKVRTILTQQRQDTQNLTNALIGLNSKIEEAKQKRNSILLRAKRLHAESTIAEVILEAPAADPSLVLERLGRRISHLEGEAGQLPELLDEAIATSATAVENAPGVQSDLLRLKHAVTEPQRKARKPLAKTRAGEATRGKVSPRAKANVAGQKRTQR